MDEAVAAPRPSVLPLLVGDRVTLRPGILEEVPVLRQIFAEPSVAHWWGDPESGEAIQRIT